MASIRGRLWHELLDELRALLADLEDGGAQLLDRAAMPARWDGFAASTLGNSGGSSDPNPFASRVAARVDYELGLPVDDEDRPGSNRDPDADKVADAARMMRAQVLEAKRHLVIAVGNKQAGTPKLRRNRPAAVEAPECVNCARFEIYSVAYKDGRCVACYGYRRRSREKGEAAGVGLDAPEHLVRARPENATRRSLAIRVDPKEHHGHETHPAAATDPAHDTHPQGDAAVESPREEERQALPASDVL